jgi:DNA sulfur modification protein DndB
MITTFPPTHLPALKAKLGDRLYYVTTLTFRQVASFIHPANEIHKSQRLSEWIQRTLVEEHADAIADYLVTAFLLL